MRGSKNTAATCLLLLIFVVVQAPTSIAEGSRRPFYMLGDGMFGTRRQKLPIYDLKSCPDDLSDRPEVDQDQRCGKQDVGSCFRDRTCWDCVNGVFRENASIQKYNSFMSACRDDYLQRRLDQMPHEQREPQAKIMRIDRKD